MKEYNSIEEFIFIHKRYPNIDESKPLYDMIWNKYINYLNDNDKKVAIKNDQLQNYANGGTRDQKEVIKAIKISTEKLKEKLENKNSIISVYYSERWGIYSIYVIVNCIKRKNLYKFRDDVPTFFEGWEVKLIPVPIWRKIAFLFTKGFLL